MMPEHVTLENRYQIQEKLGWGGFATTYLAIDLQTDQKCVVKQLSIQRVDDWKSIELFEREAKVLANLDHPHIPKYIDYLSVEEGNDTLFYIVQEYLEGKTLAQWVEDGKYFTEKEVLKITMLITRTLEYLHQFSPSIVHRDIKPDNIFLTTQNKIYLIDFGAVRDRLKVTGGSTVVGTFGYMAPEQIKGKTAPTSDIYSLGVTTIYLLSRTSPSDLKEKNGRLKFRTHVNISDKFARILEKMIEPDLKKRYQTATNLKTDLQKLAIQKPVVKKPVAAQFRQLGIGLVLIVLLLGFIGLFSFLSNRTKTPEPQTPAVQKPAAKSITPTVLGQGLVVNIRSSHHPWKKNT